MTGASLTCDSHLHTRLRHARLKPPAAELKRAVDVLDMVSHDNALKKWWVHQCLNTRERSKFFVLFLCRTDVQYLFAALAIGNQRRCAYPIVLPFELALSISQVGLTRIFCLVDKIFLQSKSTSISSAL